MRGYELDWPMVGRDATLGDIASRWRRSRTGGVVVAGQAGVGKTRLASELAQLSGSQGQRVARVIATPTPTPIPLGALAPLLPRLDTRIELRGDLMRWAVESIIGGAKGGGDDGRPLLLVIDDAQHLDDASAAVVHQFMQLEGGFLVATLRVGEPVPAAVRSLWKDGLVHRVDLPVLERDAVEELVVEVLAGSVAGDCIQSLWEASRGNPLYLRELVIGALDSGDLSDESGVWRLQQPPGPTAALTELIEVRFASLGQAARQGLEVLAIGQPLELDMFEELTEPAVIENLEERGLIRVSRDGWHERVGLAHPMYGEVLQASMGALRRRGVNAALAEVAAEPDVLRAAVWRVESGSRVDPTLLTDAAREAYFAHDNELAERLGRRALASGGGAPAGLLLGQVLRAVGASAEADEVLAAVEIEAVNDEERALASLERGLTKFWGLDQGVESEQVLVAAERALTDDKWVNEVLTQRATLTLLQGRPREAVSLTEPLLDDPSARVRASAAIAAAPALAVIGRIDRAIEVADRGLEAHMALGVQDVLSNPGIHVVSRLLAMSEAGHIAASGNLAQAAYDQALAAHSAIGQAWFALLRGRIDLLSGDLAQAVHWFAEAGAINDELGQNGLLVWCLAGQVLAASQIGDLRWADAARARLDDLAQTSMRMMEPEVLRAQGWEARLRGEPARAADHMRAAARLAQDMGARALEVAAWDDLARLGHAVEAAGPLALVASRVDGPLAATRSQRASALADDDADSLAAAGESFEGMGALLLAAESWAAASRVLRRDGEARRARSASRRCWELVARRTGVAHTPLLGLAGEAAALTPREHEIAELAARGFTSRAVAERLVLSVRTIDNNLQRVYRKLGIAGRSELAAALGVVLPTDDAE